MFLVGSGSSCLKNKWGHSIKGVVIVVMNHFFIWQSITRVLISSKLSKYHLTFFLKHEKPGLTRNNAKNKHYSFKVDGFKCIPSGATHMKPCNRSLVCSFARFHVHGTWWQTSETFILQAITFVFGIVPCRIWVIMSKK